VGAVDMVEAEVREMVRRRGIDPVVDRMAMRRLVEEAVAEYDERVLTSSLVPGRAVAYGQTSQNE
jgi:pilus assembly protein CpaF